MPVATITDPADPRLDDYRDLRDADLRRERGLFAVEGRLMVERLLVASRFRTRSILATPDGLDALGAWLPRDGVEAYVASHEVVRDLVGFKFHRGVIALAERTRPPAIETLAAGARTIIALEDVRDPENVGGVFRNAQAFGADVVGLDARSADPLGRKAIRASAGGALAVPFARTGEWPAALASLRAMGFTVIALTPDPAARDLASVIADRAAGIVLLLGSEEAGLRGVTRRLAHVEARIPTAPGVDSLNVAVAAGIALHVLRRLPSPH